MGSTLLSSDSRVSTNFDPALNTVNSSDMVGYVFVDLQIQAT